MPAGKNPKKKLLNYERDLLLWPASSKPEKVKANLVSLTSAQEKFGLSFKVEILNLAGHQF